jgi:hypothetical protein
VSLTLSKRREKMSLFNYPKHNHPHGVDDMLPEADRIWVCKSVPASLQTVKLVIKVNGDTNVREILKDLVGAKAI